MELFGQEAKRNHVYPLTNMGAAHKLRRAEAEEALRGRGGVWTYSTRISRFPVTLAPPIHTHSFSMKAQLDLPSDSEGVVMAMGGRLGGMSLYLLDGRPVFAYQSIDQQTTRIAASQPLPAGASDLLLEFQRKGAEGAHVRLIVDGKPVGEGDVAGKLPIESFSSTETFDVGSNEGSAVSEDYQDSFELTGTIRKVEFHVSKDGS